MRAIGAQKLTRGWFDQTGRRWAAMVSFQAASAASCKRAGLYGAALATPAFCTMTRTISVLRTMNALGLFRPSY